MKIKNDNDELGMGPILDADSQWQSAPGESQPFEAPKNSPEAKSAAVPPPSTTETFDIEHHERLNKERSVW